MFLLHSCLNSPQANSRLIRESAGEAVAFVSLHIQPGKPQQNAYIERYNRTVRHEWLGQYLFRTIEEVKDTATEWLWTYNHERPNMALGGITPAQKLRRQMEVQPSG
jgi:putative transposase